MNIPRRSFIVFCSAVFTGLCLFLTQIFIARKLGPESMGSYSLFSTILSITFLLGHLGVGTSSFYFLNRKKKEASRLFSNLFIFGLIWGVLLSTLVAILAKTFPSLFEGLGQQYFLIALVLIPMLLLYGWTLSLLWAADKIFPWFLFSVLHGLLILILNIVFLNFFNMGFIGTILAMVGGVIFPFLFTIFFAIKIFSINFPLDLSLLREQVKFGVSTYLGDVFHVINFKINFFILNFLLDITSVGYYSIGYSVAAILFLFPLSLQQTLSPVWSSLEEKEIDKRTPQTGRQALLLGLIGTIILASFGPWFITFLYGRKFLPSILPFLLMLPGGIFATFASIFFNNFFAKGKPYITSAILFSTLILNIILNFFFIPYLGVGGSALASSFSYFFAAIAAIIIFQKMTKRRFSEIIKITPEDFRFLLNTFKKLFILSGQTPDKILNKDLINLKEYFEEKAKQNAYTISATFESPHVYKKILYTTRFDKIMKLLELKSTDKVLDIGCGEGYYTRAISSVTPYVTATDIAENVLRRAKSFNPNSTVKYVCCPAEKLPFPDNSFDKVLMADVIEHLFDWRMGIKEARRVLKPGGKFIIATRNKHSYLNFLFNLKNFIRNESFTRDTIKQFSMKELLEVLKDDFVIEKFSYANYSLVFLPEFFVNLVGFSKIKNLVGHLEELCEKIPLVRDQGFILFVRVSKL